MVRTGFSFLKLRIDECHSSILRLRALFSRSLSELSALVAVTFGDFGIFKATLAKLAQKILRL